MSTLIQPSFSSGEVGPSIYGRVDIARYSTGLRTALNVVVRPSGGVANRAGFEWVGYCGQFGNDPRNIPFQFNTTQAYVLEFGDLYMRVVMDGGYVLNTAVNITGATQASPVVVTAVAHGYSDGQHVYVTGVGGMTELNGRWFLVANKTTNTFELNEIVGGAGGDGSAYSAYTSGGTVASIYEIVSPYAQADLATLKYVQSADIMTLTHPSYEVRELSRTGHAAWAFSNVTFAPSIAAPTGWAGTASSPGSRTYKYKVTAVAGETFEESLPQYVEVASANELNATNTIELSTASLTSGAVKYNVYKLDNGNGKSTGGIYGFIGATENDTFIDDFINPDTSNTPPEARNPITGADNRPGAVSYYEQRRVFGGANNAPDTSYFTQVGNAKNLNVSSPSRDDDAITATLNSRQVNEIRHYVPLNDLLVFTSGGEWKVGSGPDSALTAATLRQRVQSEWGCSHVPPIVIGSTTLFVQTSGRFVRTLGYQLEVDGYEGGNLTVLVGHMFENKTIVAWAWAQIPDSVIWVVLSDGTALSLTYDQEQSVIGWCRHETDGFFESVTSIKENNEDAVYFIVRRVVNGVTVRYQERLKERFFTDVQDCFFIDSGLSLDNPIAITGATKANPVVVTAVAHGFSDGDEVDITSISGMTELNGFRFTVANKTANTFELSGTDGSAYSAYSSGGVVRKAYSTVTGLRHLEGRAVVALADGNVVADLVVTDGAVTLPNAASRVHVGLGYTSDVETLNLEASSRDFATLQGKRMKINNVTIRFLRSRGIFMGPSFDKLTEMKWRENEAYGQPTSLLTGDKIHTIPQDWNKEGRIALRQSYPLPMEIQAVIPDVTFGS